MQQLILDNAHAACLLAGMSPHLAAFEETRLRAVAETLAFVRCEHCGRGIVWYFDGGVDTLGVCVHLFRKIGQDAPMRQGKVVSPIYGFAVAKLEW